MRYIDFLTLQINNEKKKKKIYKRTNTLYYYDPYIPIYVYMRLLIKYIVSGGFILYNAFSMQKTKTKIRGKKNLLCTHIHATRFKCKN